MFLLKFIFYTTLNLIFLLGGYLTILAVYVAFGNSVSPMAFVMFALVTVIPAWILSTVNFIREENGHEPL